MLLYFSVSSIYPARSITRLCRGFFHTEEDQKENTGDSKRVYFRVMEIDATEDGSIEKVQGIFNTVFHNLSMRAVIEAPAEDGSPVSELIDGMRKLPNLHFVEQ